MKKLLLATILTIGSTSAFAMSDYTYCKKFSELGGKTVDIRSQGYSKETLLDELNKHGAITAENKAMLDFKLGEVTALVATEIVIHLFSVIFQFPAMACWLLQ